MAREPTMEDYGDLAGARNDEYTWKERHWKLLRTALPWFRKQEEEDHITDLYVDQLGPRARFGPNGEEMDMPYDYDPEKLILPLWEYQSANEGNVWVKHPSRHLMNDSHELKENDDVIQTDEGETINRLPRMKESFDKYTLLTWFFLRSRVQGETREIAEMAVRLFVQQIIQLLLAATIWGLGSTEIDGGRLEVVVASFASGMVGILSQIFGLLGVIGENEAYLRKYWIGQLWLIAILVAFLYTECHHFLENDNQCSPSTANLNPEAENNCSESTAIITAALIINIIQLFFSFLSIYACTVILDSINDRTSLEDNLLIFKYFQIYTVQLGTQMKTRRRKSLRVRRQSSSTEPYGHDGGEVVESVEG